MQEHEHLERQKKNWLRLLFGVRLIGSCAVLVLMMLSYRFDSWPYEAYILGAALVVVAIVIWFTIADARKYGLEALKRYWFFPFRWGR